MNSQGSSLYLNACPWLYWFIGELGNTLYSYTYVHGLGFRPCILIHMFRVQGSDLVFLYICSGFRVQTLYSCICSGFRVYTLYSCIYVLGSGFIPCILIHMFGFRPCILVYMFRVQGSDLAFMYICLGLLFLYICFYKVFRYCKLSSVRFFVSFI